MKKSISISFDIVMIGAGGVARSLATSLHEAGYRIMQVFSHTMASAKSLAAMVEAEPVTDPAKVTDAADIYIYCLKDDVLATIPEWKLPFKSGLHMHTSGTCTLDVFVQAGCEAYGSIYPFQTFSRDRLIPFDEVPVFIKTNNRLSYDKANCLMQTVSTKVYENKIRNMMSLHVAGIFANNFTTAMVRIAYDMLRQARIPHEVLIPMVRESAAKVLDIGPEAAQSGPASRGDEQVVAMHLDFLADDQEYCEIYRMMSDYIGNHRPKSKK